jgi:hypothetical protein
VIFSYCFKYVITCNKSDNIPDHSASISWISWHSVDCDPCFIFVFAMSIRFFPSRVRNEELRPSKKPSSIPSTQTLFSNDRRFLFGSRLFVVLSVVAMQKFLRDSLLFSPDRRRPFTTAVTLIQRMASSMFFVFR